MSNLTAQPEQTYKYLHTTPVARHSCSRAEAIETAYTVFAFIMAVLLICLGLRIILALLVVTGPIAHGLTVISDPAVAPFTKVFNDAHQMIQASTALAFTAYYTSYSFVAMLSRLLRNRSEYRYRTTA